MLCSSTTYLYVVKLARPAFGLRRVMPAMCFAKIRTMPGSDLRPLRFGFVLIQVAQAIQQSADALQYASSALRSDPTPAWIPSTCSGPQLLFPAQCTEWCRSRMQ